MKTTLVFERSTAKPTIACFADDGTIKFSFATPDSPTGRCPQWVKMLAEMMEQHNVDPKSIQKILVGIGPGSFSGIRAAIACAQGIAIANGIPVNGINSAAAVALHTARAEHQEFIAVIGDARRGTCWLSQYHVTSDRITLLDGSPITHKISDFTTLPRAETANAIFPQAFVVTPDYSRLLGYLPQLNSYQPTAEDIFAVDSILTEKTPIDPLPIYLHPAVTIA